MGLPGDTTPMQFTKDQLTDWKAYERVRSGGRYNMFDARARQATGMSGERYSFTMINYSALKEAVGAAGDSASDRKRKSPTDGAERQNPTNPSV